jgi:probable phosphomutase (TIGR03848 family)
VPTRRKYPPPTTVLFIRHGLTPTTGKEMPAAGAGAGLSELGRRQAEEAAEYIAGRRGDLPPLAALYTSPLLRTRETAAIVGKALDLTPIEDARLADVNVGEWAGVPLKQLARRPEWPTVMHYPSGVQFPGGEALADMRGRVAAALRAVTAAHPGQAALVVSHADPIKSALAEALGASFDLFQRVAVAPASVSVISYSALGPTVLLVNWTGASRCQGGRKGGAP